MAETVGKPKGLTNSLSYYWYSSPHLNFLIHWTREYNGRKNTKLCSCNASIDSVSGDLWSGQHVDIIPVDHEGEVIHRMSTALDGSVCVGLSPYVCCKYWSVKCLWVWCVMIEWCTFSWSVHVTAAGVSYVLEQIGWLCTPTLQCQQIPIVVVVHNLLTCPPLHVAVTSTPAE